METRRGGGGHSSVATPARISPTITGSELPVIATVISDTSTTSSVNAKGLSKIPLGLVFGAGTVAEMLPPIDAPTVRLVLAKTTIVLFGCGDSEPPDDADIEELGDGDADGDFDADADLEFDTDADKEEDIDGDGETLGVGEADADGDGEALGVLDDDAEGLNDDDTDSLGIEVFSSVTDNPVDVARAGLPARPSTSQSA